MINDPNTHLIVSISDIHFGAIDALYMYNNLKTQFIQRITPLDFDILAICGDIFEAKYMSNNPIISYSLSFIDDVVKLCRAKNATLIIIDGTQSHDSGQLKLFYHYLSDPTVDVRIVEEIKFEMVKGMRVLCIPEKYGVPEETYCKFLFESGAYDLCMLHGTFRGSFHGSEIATLNSTKAPVFSLASFCNCMGPILMGHYHIAGCYETYAYYHGSTFRYKFGEEMEKGFLVTLYNQITRWHCTQLVEVKSHSYITLNINDIIYRDPKEIIEYIKSYKVSHGIDFIRIQYNYNDALKPMMDVVKSYFRTISDVTIQELKDSSIEQSNSTIDNTPPDSEYPFILDNGYDEMTKFVMYVNQNEGCDFITVDKLISILEDKIS